MAPTRRTVLGMAAVTVGLSGCTGGGDGAGGDGDGGSPTDAATTTSTATDDGGMAATVRTTTHDELGEILVDAEGRTLYMFDSDERGAGASTCSGGCADAWPPLTVDGEPSAGDGVAAELTTFEREDGSTQVAANGWPLYYFANDGSPGDVNGQGANDVWWVLDPAGAPVRGSGGTSESGTGGSGPGGY